MAALSACFSAHNPKGKKRAVLVDHRRTGKDKLAFNYMVPQAFNRVGVYYYFLPTYQQGRKILWDGIDKDGFKFLDHIPESLVLAKNQTEMKITLAHPEHVGKAGSIIQVVGSDNINTIVGTNPVGCVFSEYALQDPRGWDFVRPILRENGGWAWFVYTPRGKNHGSDLYEMAKTNPDWYVEKLTIADTWGRGGTISEEDIEQERRDGMDEALIQQEFYCSFDAAVRHAVLGKEMMAARAEGRITSIPYQKGVVVNTYWDIGRDTTAVWFAQSVRNRVHLIDYYDSQQSTMEKDFVQINGKGYMYGRHFMPWDADSNDWKSGKTAKEIASDAGYQVEVGQKYSKTVQIDATRNIMNRCWFDEKNCQRGLDALSSWHFEWDDATRSMSRNPKHDWASHGGDAIAQLAMAHEDEDDWTPARRYEEKPAPRRRGWMSA